MRLIDADALLKNVDKYPYAQGLMDLIADIQTAPSIDIVRCKECKLGGTEDCPMDEIDDEYFCNFGEREDE